MHLRPQRVFQQTDSLLSTQKQYHTLSLYVCYSKCISLTGHPLKIQMNMSILGPTSSLAEEALQTSDRDDPPQ